MSYLASKDGHNRLAEERQVGAAGSTPRSRKRTGLRKKLVTITLATLLVLSVMAGTAEASEIDLGSPATIGELLDSPEYREWHADVLRLYQAFFNRTPDTGGAAYWINIYEDGATLDDIAWGFSNSTEFQNAYGPSLTNGDFLSIVYSNVLGRAPDEVGYDYWLGQMNAGLSQHEVVRWVVANPEFVIEHPFTGSATPLEDYLVDPNQVGGWDSFYDVFIPTDPFQVSNSPGCEAGIATPKNSLTRSFDLLDDGTFDESVYEFSSAAAASNYLDRVRQSIPLCQNAPFNYFGSPSRIFAGVDLNSTGLGDEAVAQQFFLQTDGHDAVEAHFIYVRIDRVVFLVDMRFTGHVVVGSFGYASEAIAQVHAVLAR